MNKHRLWLLAEIECWTQEGIIAPPQAEAIRARYPAPAILPWGLIVFSSLGAVMLGLGVILLIAFNWAEIPRLGKLAIVLGSIAGAHGAGLWLIGQSGWRKLLGEALHLLGTMLFGAGIWLVAQAYHIDEHYPNGFLFWALGALALAWALRSVPQLVAATALISIWSMAEMTGYGIHRPFALALLVVGVFPLVWWLRSAVALAMTLLALAFVLLVNSAHWAGGAAAIQIGMALAVTCLGLAQWPRLTEIVPGARRVFSFFGAVGFLFSCFLLTFKGQWVHYLLGERPGETPVWLAVYVWGSFALALGAWLPLAVPAIRQRQSHVPAELWLAPLLLVYGRVPGLAAMLHKVLPGALVFNAVFLAFALVWIGRGCRDGRLREVVLGCVLFAIWTFARYFDLFASLPARAFAFLVLGAALFGAGFLYRKRVEENERRATP